MSRFPLRPILPFLALPLLSLSFFVSSAPAQSPLPPGAPAPQSNFFIHAFHKEKLGGTLECSLCHVADGAGSVTLKRPGHDQCMTCHSDDFNTNLKQVVCAQCHSSFPPTGAADLLPFPRYKGSRAILFQFAHAKHVDAKARIDPKTGFRADCTFCHKFDAQGVFATFPGHAQCAACHSKPGITPQLNAQLSADTCRGCHTPEEIENPGFTETRQFTGAHEVQGKYVNITFNHVAHFKVKDQFDLHCTTCHYAIPTSTSIQNITLPKMIDCVQCHDSAKSIKAEFRMSNCKTCHADTVVTNTAVPLSHTKGVKPDFHTEAFRTHHAEESLAADAKCFVCHQNIAPSAAGGTAQCNSCHQVMLPANHTSRWKDDLHGKYAALDRVQCTTCHTAAYCSDCHNELPRSHEPLAQFKAGAHAYPAMLDLRTCLTCHTYQNTCSECHLNQIVPQVLPQSRRQ